MVFHPEGQFQQFPHCKFRENIVRLLYIPSIVHPHQAKSVPPPPTHLFLAVNKFGKVGLYHPENFFLVHTYCLDLTVPVGLLAPNHSTKPTSNPPVIPKCARTHLVTDATYSTDTNCIIFSTTKSLLQWYDIGDIQKQDIGLGLFPRQEFLSLSEGSYPLANIPNRGHVECHRLFGLNNLPTCLEYHGRKLIIGDVEGGVTLIGIPTPKYPLGRRKIRGTLHKIHISELPHGLVQYYKGHHHPITDICLISERSLILTSSKDKKFSVYVKDTSDTPVESIIVSIPKGVNSIGYSPDLKMVATGSDDYVVRLFNQFVMKMPQMEMFGHRSPVIAVKFIQVDFFVVGAEQGDNPVLLLSFSADTELRAWDPLTFICLQSVYLSFPIGSTIMCKTPEFATRSLLVFQPVKSEITSGVGMIILLYCNSYARIPLEPEGSTRWPGIDYDKFVREFEELSLEYDKKLKEKLRVSERKALPSQPSVQVQQYSPVLSQDEVERIEKDGGDECDGGDKEVCLRLSKEEMSQMERKVDAYLNEILELRQTIKKASAVDSSSSAIMKHSIPSAASSSGDGNTGRLSESTMEGDDEDHVVGGDDPLTVSIQATNRFFEFRRAKQTNFEGLQKRLQRMLSYGHAFNQYPLLELEPIQLSRGNLALPENMRKELGIPSVNHITDLMTPQAQRYFGTESNRIDGCSRSGASFSYNFNHSQQKRKRGGGGAKSQSLQQVPHGAVFGASRFTVVGQKLRNAYEDENFLMTGAPEEVEEEEEPGDTHIDFY